MLFDSFYSVFWYRTFGFVNSAYLNLQSFTYFYKLVWSSKETFSETAKI